MYTLQAKSTISLMSMTAVDDVVIQSFSQGSIVADILIRYKQKPTSTVKALRQIIGNATLKGEILLGDQARIPVTLFKTEPYNRCIVEGVPLCHPADTTRCSFDSETEESRCLCLPNTTPRTSYSCQRVPESDDAFLIIYIVAGVLGFILISAMAIFLVTTRRRYVKTSLSYWVQQQLKSRQIICLINLSQTFTKQSSGAEWGQPNPPGWR